ncbi:hypothetical protein PO909_010757 [Leuciscus waleckii]
MHKIARASLIIYEKPFIALNDQLLQTVEANAGQEEAKIVVKYYAYPEPSVKWYKNDQLIVWKDEYRMKPNRGSLTIYGVTEKDAGNYTVVLTNKITKEEQKRIFQLLVHEIMCKLECTSVYIFPQLLRIVTNLTNQRVNVSDSTTLECEVTGTPTPTVVWTKDNQTVMEGSGVILKRSNRVLTIQRVKKEDSGLYICTACNQLGCDYDEAHITVDGAEDNMNLALIMPIGAVVIAMFLWFLIIFVICNRKRPPSGREDNLLRGPGWSYFAGPVEAAVEEVVKRSPDTTLHSGPSLTLGW